METVSVTVENQKELKVEQLISKYEILAIIEDKGICFCWEKADEVLVATQKHFKTLKECIQTVLNIQDNAFKNTDYQQIGLKIDVNVPPLILKFKSNPKTNFDRELNLYIQRNYFIYNEMKNRYEYFCGAVYLKNTNNSSIYDKEE